MRRIATSLAWILVIGLWSACAPPSGTATPCNDDSDCQSAQVCVGGQCHAGDAAARPDAGTTVSLDAGGAPRDGGSDGGPSLDAGPASSDAGSTGSDAGASDEDGGAGDAGVVDGGAGDAGLLDAGYDAGLPPGCTQHLASDGARYVICETLVTRDDAQSSCEAMGLTLAEPDDEAENAFVATLMEGITTRAWIGGTDEHVEGVFAWGSGAPLGFDSFYPGEPNNLGSEDCLEMWAGGSWNDNWCGAVAAYVCGEPSQPLGNAMPYCLQLPSACRCQTVVFEGSVYTLCPELRSFDDAVDACAAHGMAPVKVETSKEASFLVREATLLETSFWIGLGDPDGDDVQTWRDGSTTNTGLYSSEPGPGACALASASGFAPLACTSKAGYACEHVAESALPADCVAAQQPYVACSTPRSFFDARAVCQAAGLELMVIDDEEENDDALLYLPALGPLWIGAADLAGRGLIRSVTHALPTYSDFAPYEPNGNNGAHRCVELGDGTLQWHDASCASQRAFLCEPVLSLPPLPASGALCQTQPAACPCELRVRERVLYALCPLSANWDDAERSCAALGMQMLEPGTQDADAFLQSSLNALPDWNGTWTGFTDRVTEGTFLGPSDAPPSYTSWGAAQPDDFEGADCVEYSPDHGNLWNDLHCGYARKLACQSELSAPQCIDFDRDGHGTGCALGPDCDDFDPAVNPAALDICNGVDDDCSGEADDDPYGCPCTPVGSVAEGQYLLCERALPWVAARNLCLAFSAELAVPGDDAEADRMEDHLFTAGLTNAWLGAHDRNLEGSYETTTGGPLSFTLWGAGQPDALDSEDCVEWFPSGWHDAACSNALPFLCEL